MKVHKNMFCSHCGWKVDKENKFCNKCGSKLEAKSNRTNTIEREQHINSSSSTQSDHRLFNLFSKKSFLQALFLYLIVLVLFIPLYITFFGNITQDNDFYYINGFISAYVVLTLVQFKRSEWLYYLLAPLTFFIAYLFGLHLGLLMVIPTLMLPVGNDLEDNEKELINILLWSGIKWYVIGVVVTLGSLLYSYITNQETHWMLYGLVVIGIINLLKVNYYLFNDIARQNYIEDLEKPEEKKEAFQAEPVRNNLLRLGKIVAITAIGFVVLIVVFSIVIAFLG